MAHQSRIRQAIAAQSQPAGNPSKARLRRTLRVAAREHKRAGSNKSHELVGFSVFATEGIAPVLFEMNAFPAYLYPTMKNAAPRASIEHDSNLRRRI